MHENHQNRDGQLLSEFILDFSLHRLIRLFQLGSQWCSRGSPGLESPWCLSSILKLVLWPPRQVLGTKDCPRRTPGKYVVFLWMFAFPLVRQWFVHLITWVTQHQSPPPYRRKVKVWPSFLPKENVSWKNKTSCYAQNRTFSESKREALVKSSFYKGVSLGLTPWPQSAFPFHTSLTKEFPLLTFLCKYPSTFQKAPTQRWWFLDSSLLWPIIHFLKWESLSTRKPWGGGGGGGRLDYNAH